MAVTLFLFFFSGCTFIPFYHRPASPVPQQFANAQDAQGDGPQASEIGWQEFFKDPRLQQLIGLSLKNNRDYRVALLNVQQIRDQYRIIEYAFLPSFEIDANSLRERSLLTSNSYSKFRSYTADVNTSYEVDVFGHIRSLRKQILEQYLATREASRSAQISLVSEVAIQYLTVLGLDQQLVLLQQTLESVKSYDHLIQQSYQLGNSSALDLHLAEAQIDTAQTQIASYKRQRSQAQDALMLLIGQSIPDDLPPGQSLTDQDIIEDMPVGTSSTLIERRPDILQAEHNLEAANANIGAVRAAFFPTITLVASDGTASVQLAKLFNPGTQIWSFSPQVSLPLFNQNTNLANLNAAEVGKQINIAQYEKAIQTAFSEVSDAIAGRDTLNEQQAAQQALVKAQQARYDLEGVRYHDGIDNYLTVLLAQQDLYTAQQNLIQVNVDRLANLIALYKALGGGWK